LSSIEREVIHEISDDLLSIEEDAVLSALRKHGHAALDVLKDLFLWVRQGGIAVSAEHADDWIDILREIFPRSEWAEGGNDSVCSYLASIFSDSGRDRILARANDPNDPARDFVLAQFARRMSTISTDDLTPEAAKRLLDLYLDGELDPYPSPGGIATEPFVAQVILPLAETIGPEPYRRESMERILEEAGRRHDRRYLPPWRLRTARSRPIVD
jgi:hypothetical protein